MFWVCYSFSTPGLALTPLKNTLFATVCKHITAKEVKQRIQNLYSRSTNLPRLICLYVNCGREWTIQLISLSPNPYC